jgi:demethylmenaquinone methyltransferase/2-methoxy-6-polyprenyl-1,4-benzoquinol methylase/phosphoethanolamine N-methyltransferase
MHIHRHGHSHGGEAPAQTEGRLIGWAAHYDALTYLLTLGQVGRLRARTVALARLEPGERVLDVGCGTGGVTLPARQRVGGGGAAAGIDPSPEMIAVARRKARRAGLEIDFRVGVIEALPYADGSFDAVTSSLMMHHLPEPLQVSGLAEVYRVLKPGGRLLIADMLPAGRSVHQRLVAALGLHHGDRAARAIAGLPERLAGAGFAPVEVLDDRVLTIGFIRAAKRAG